jgi:hypothetical protein
MLTQLACGINLQLCIAERWMLTQLGVLATYDYGWLSSVLAQLACGR